MALANPGRTHAQPTAGTMATRRGKVWDERVDFGFYNRFDGVIQQDSQVLAEQ